ncbi:hypothetical protein Q8W71_08765 [Methylobacterium sp. NEAU 140]|uniref:hypothetical protein n=1 Tax=Methylobacterium sp. NEAU 140 TaxID=3064945 RepID=UPI002734EB77|nr:hypothetical protein [Methylobacterium sp. NEAU 140]MDP4022712.1 hypothetical protein [Methylobacterium sp. NEAU 140]
MKLLPVIAALALTAVPARADVTAAQRAACTGDVWRLCTSEIPNVEGIKACLRREKPRLSAGCRTVMESADRGVQTVSARTGAVARN